ncbi:MAG: glycoside hydrolase family 95 protein [Phycisphaerae bacterium]|nr:glycoside hydrolase family 95 protein [Phycisphaerae bacterium]
MKQVQISVVVLVVLAVPGLVCADAGPMVLFYDAPAAYQANTTSNEALPIGNGRLAAMVYGGIQTETIQFNEDTVWSGSPHDYTHAGAAAALGSIRDQVWAGKGRAAWAAAKDTFMSVPLRQCPYQPTAELRMTFSHARGSSYRRELDLTTATASVTYQVGAVTFRRDCFASYPDNVIVVRLTASEPGQIDVTLALATPHAVTAQLAEDKDLVLRARVTHVGQNKLASGIAFEARARILAEGGEVSVSGQSLAVAGADAVTVILGAATNFVRYDDLGGDPAQVCLSTVDRAAHKGFDRLRQDQLADYQALFNRVTLDLGTSAKAEMPINRRLDAVGAGMAASGMDAGTFAERFAADDLQLVALNFQMARYLVISGSRPGSQPLGLQGKWNNELEPSWEGKLTLNINAEMNYWAAEVANLAECHEPFFDMIRDLSKTGASVARQHYNADGWVVHHNTDLWRGAAPINNAGGLWPTGGAWLCMHLWRHYEYSGDPNFLQEAYPLMKGAAEFFADFLVEDPRAGGRGYLLTNPTHSPEQPNPALGDDGEVVAGTTMDSQLVRGLFTAVIEAGQILGIDAEFRQQLDSMRADLPPNQIGRHGQLQEWLEDVDQPNNQHRHMSHLVDMMPLGVVTPHHTPDLAAAVRVVLDWKGDPSNNTAWSRAWKMCLRTRLLQGDHAYMILNDLLGRSHTDNMTFSTKGNENQIDGNLGALMGTAEMLLQSHHGELFLLPALPKKMAAGAVTGLRARGGFEVDLTWEQSALSTAVIRSRLGKACRIRSAWPIRVHDGVEEVPVQSIDTHLYEFPTVAGKSYTISATRP